MMYEIAIIECASQRLQVSVENLETGESIHIDETLKDVKQLYLLLKQYFEDKDDTNNEK